MNWPMWLLAVYALCVLALWFMDYAAPVLDD